MVINDGCASDEVDIADYWNIETHFLRNDDDNKVAGVHCLFFAHYWSI